MNPANFLADLNKIEEKIGLPIGFITKLMEEDDWSFVIKAHGIIEASITHLITLNTNEKLHTLNNKMNLTGRISKLEVVRCLELLDSRILPIIEDIAIMRNTFAHDVTAFSMTLEEYFSNTQRREQFAQKISQLFKGYESQTKSNYIQALIDTPKRYIALLVLYILAEILFQIDPQHKIETEKQFNELNDIIQNNPIIAIIGLIFITIGANISKKSSIDTSTDTDW